jgi:hypothetical protein
MSDLKHIANLLDQLIGIQSLTKIILGYSMSQSEDKNFIRINNQTFVNINSISDINLYKHGSSARMDLTYGSPRREITITSSDIIAAIVQKINNSDMTKRYEQLES